MRLRYTDPALADLTSILDYIAVHSPSGSMRVQTRISFVIDLLLTYPDIGVRTDDPTIRRLVASPYPYLILYEAQLGEIIIHAIRHAARDVPDVRKKS